LFGRSLLEGALAWVECEIVGEIGAGDHVLAHGRVLDLSAYRDGRPLLFFHRPVQPTGR
jgi:3-hydroxy-9,10-secoandrosta-1,3,5(10)-triene-9,17-dione monooxygenase reductase component